MAKTILINYEKFGLETRDIELNVQSFRCIRYNLIENVIEYIMIYQDSFRAHMPFLF